MARARNIKPSFFQNEDLAELTPITRLAFIGMWTIADFKGCIEFRPKRLKVQLMPYDECDFEVIANDLDKSGLIAIYSVEGQRYLKIINFEKHQNPHKNERESGSDIPDYSPEATVHAGSQTIQINPDKDGTAPADPLLLNPSLVIPDSTIPPQAAKPSATKKSKTALPNDFSLSDRVIAWANEKGHGNLQAHLENFISAAKRNGYVYADWDEALMEAIRKDWAKLSQAKGLPTDLDSINARNNAEAKRLLFGTPSDLRTINA